MDFFELIGERHSIRAFKAKPVEEAKIQKILEAVNLAPSAGNLQGFEVVLIKDNERLKELAEACFEQKFIGQAGIALVFLANPERSSSRYAERGEQLYCLQDATIAACYAQLAAVELGLASCWIGAFDDKAVSEVVNAGNLRPVAVIPIGYADEKGRPRKRRELSDLVKEEKIE